MKRPLPMSNKRMHQKLDILLREHDACEKGYQRLERMSGTRLDKAIDVLIKRRDKIIDVLLEIKDAYPLNQEK